MAEGSKQNLYAYVDESGQDTQGAMFLVSVVVTGEEQETIRHRLQAIERGSGKLGKKWTKARLTERVPYIEALLQSSALFGPIYQLRS